MAVNDLSEWLPCGVDLDSLIAQVAEDRPPADPAHQANCPYCQVSLRAFRGGWRDVQALADEPVPIPPGLTERIMVRVRALSARLVDSIQLATPRGDTRVSHAVVGQVVRRAALAVPGVLFASAHPRPHDPPEPARLSVAVHLVVAFGPALDALAAAVRAVIHQRVPALTGADLGRIDLTIEDVVDELTDDLDQGFP